MVKKNFTRKTIANLINKKIGFSKNLSSEVVDNFFETIISSLIKENSVKITSFGTFKVKYKKERTGRNPKTKVMAKISSRRVVKFKTSESFKKLLNK